jgi:hypothetical protein
VNSTTTAYYSCFASNLIVEVNINAVKTPIRVNLGVEFQASITLGAIGTDSGLLVVLWRKLVGQGDKTVIITAATIIWQGVSHLILLIKY